jgi:hypothetical protein
MLHGACRQWIRPHASLFSMSRLTNPAWQPGHPAYDGQLPDREVAHSGFYPTWFAFSKRNSHPVHWL